MKESENLLQRISSAKVVYFIWTQILPKPELTIIRAITYSLIWQANVYNLASLSGQVLMEGIRKCISETRTAAIEIDVVYNLKSEVMMIGMLFCCRTLCFV